LALKISYANAVYILREDWTNVRKVHAKPWGLDPRIGTQFLKAGLGCGGFVSQGYSSSLSRRQRSASISKFERERVNTQRIAAVFWKRISKHCG